MAELQLSLDMVRSKDRRRRLVIAVLIAVLVLLGSLVAVASLDYPDLTIRSMSVDRIDIPSDTVYIGM
ncbi:MAG: hypothetical protein GWN18_06045, partial [Thermoplasmata archaeon]|nr:hypothetical protein [Thermoplasmata archaeon]NIS11611.1 hypothetical protein [Thermoplasmata archaeon]NIS19530.1 hypothetical protein [Thermoplasmata archaeon]NIT76099.1 hypothetical protein [Thermoplasmata archaeon]NIU48646.1 hypothetical protein [Thermoplasmata archaeon]